MPYLLKDKEGNILSYAQAHIDPNAEAGETVMYADLSFYEYSRRLVLSHNGLSCSTVQAYQSGPDVVIDVETSLDVLSVDLDINGVIENVKLTDKRGKLILSTAHPGVFIISPADRKLFCAAGKSVIAVEVAPNA